MSECKRKEPAGGACLVKNPWSSGDHSFKWFGNSFKLNVLCGWTKFHVLSSQFQLLVVVIVFYQKFSEFFSFSNGFLMCMFVSGNFIRMSLSVCFLFCLLLHEMEFLPSNCVWRLLNDTSINRKDVCNYLLISVLYLELY